MNLRELAKAYRENADRLLREPFKHRFEEVRKAHLLLAIDLELELRKLASSNGGCVSCIHSKPHENAPLDLSARSCELGLRQEDCGKWERIEF